MGFIWEKFPASAFLTVYIAPPSAFVAGYLYHIVFISPERQPGLLRDCREVLLRLAQAVDKGTDFLVNTAACVIKLV